MPFCVKKVCVSWLKFVEFSKFALKLWSQNDFVNSLKSIWVG